MSSFPSLTATGQVPKDDDVMIRVFPGMTFPAWINGRHIHAPSFTIVGVRSNPLCMWDTSIPTYTATELGMDNKDLLAYLSYSAIADSRIVALASRRAALAPMRALEHQLIVHLGTFHRRKHALEAFRRFN